MKSMNCDKRGASDWEEQNGYRVCRFCGTRYQPAPDDAGKKDSVISVNSDIARLLEKCRQEPRRARKYANLILDIDPTNKEALKYL